MNITDLPIDIFSAVLTSWLTLEDLCRFDIAFSSRSKRSDFVEYIESSEVVFDGNVNKYYGGRFLNWISQRGIHLKAIKCSDNCPSLLYNGDEDDHSNTIKDVTFLDMIDLCNHITSMDLSECNEITDEGM
eukprot:gene37076-48410_t